MKMTRKSLGLSKLPKKPKDWKLSMFYVGKPFAFPIDNIGAIMQSRAVKLKESNVKAIYNSVLGHTEKRILKSFKDQNAAISIDISNNKVISSIADLSLLKTIDPKHRCPVPAGIHRATAHQRLKDKNPHPVSNIWAQAVFFEDQIL